MMFPPLSQVFGKDSCSVKFIMADSTYKVKQIPIQIP